MSEDVVQRGGSTRSTNLERVTVAKKVLLGEAFAQTTAAEQASALIGLLRLLDPASNQDAEVRARATQALAALAREVHLPDATAEIERQLGGVPWAPDFAPDLFQTLEALGWVKALGGDYFSAFRHLKRALAVTASHTWKVAAACDRAYLARAIGEPRWSRQELDDAEQAANEAAWDAAQVEERTGLLLLAELFCGLDSARAATHLDHYRELSERPARAQHPRAAHVTACAGYSIGVVEIALGDKKRGLADLRSARETFERLGYDFRVARCLAAEYAATGDSDARRMASERLLNYGQSWLAAELRAADQPEIDLPPMQKRVFEEVCLGKSTAQIAQTLGRSGFTVNNHLKEIFKAFRVNKRSALMAEALRRGLIKAS